MPDTAVDLGADLYLLWRAGRDNLPWVAREYANANDHIANTDARLDGALWRPAEFGGGSYGPVHGSWKTLRDELQAILGDTSVNLELTGEALCLAATTYAQTDTAAAAELNRLKHLNGDPIPPTVPAPRYP